VNVKPRMIRMTDAEWEALERIAQAQERKKLATA
jgi:hypothetical protein